MTSLMTLSAGVRLSVPACRRVTAKLANSGRGSRTSHRFSESQYFGQEARRAYEESNGANRKNGKHSNGVFHNGPLRWRMGQYAERSVGITEPVSILTPVSISLHRSAYAGTAARQCRTIYSTAIEPSQR